CIDLSHRSWLGADPCRAHDHRNPRTRMDARTRQTTHAATPPAAHRARTGNKQVESAARREGLSGDCPNSLSLSADGGVAVGAQPFADWSSTASVEGVCVGGLLLKLIW